MNKCILKFYTQCFTVLQHVLIHPHTPLDLLEKLATDKSYEIRSGVAKNPSTPIILLQQLANDEDKGVRSIAYTNLNKLETSPSYTLEQKKAILNSLANTNEPSLARLAVFLSDYAKESLLVSNFSSPSWLERYAIAQNKNTPSDILKHLEKDGNQIVRAAARANQRRRQESDEL